MFDEDADNWQQVIQGLRAGESGAVRAFCNRYGSLMHALADQHLSPKLRRRVGAEDVVQSVCRTFFRRAKAGEFQLPDSDALWRLLCAITLTKVREQARFHGRDKRGIGREIPLDAPASADSTSAGLSRFGADDTPTPADAAAFADQFQALVESLDEEERQLVGLKLEDHTNEEAAERIGCSERTVRRLMKNVQARLERILLDQGE